MFLRRLAMMMALTGLLLAACSAPPAPRTPTPTALPAPTTHPAVYASVTPAQLAEMLKSKDFFFVNVHTPYAGEIAATDAFIPYDQTAQRLGQYPASRQAKIVVYCRSGRMSAMAAAELVKAGYTNVWDLTGGMSAWEQAGFQLVQK